MSGSYLRHRATLNFRSKLESNLTRTTLKFVLKSWLLQTVTTVTVDSSESLSARFTMKLSREGFHIHMKLIIMEHSNDFQSSKRVN